MSTLLNDPGCSALTYGNTGKPNCDIKPGMFIGGILIPRNHEFSAANVANIVTVLSAMCLASYGSRAYPIYEFVEVVDNTEDPVKVTSAFGEEVIVRQGRPKWTVKLDDKVGAGYWKKICNFDKTNDFDILMVDHNNVIWGKDGTTAGTLMGFGMSFEKINPKMHDGTNPVQYRININLTDARYLNEDIAFIKPATSVRDNVKGNIDLVLHSGGAAALHTLKVCITEEISGVNCYNAFVTALEQTAAWVVTAADGGAITVSGVADSATLINADDTSKLGGWILTVSGDSAADVLTVSLASPAALHALATPIGGAPDEGYESNTIAFTIPT